MMGDIANTTPTASRIKNCLFERMKKAGIAASRKSPETTVIGQSDPDEWAIDTSPSPADCEPSPPSPRGEDMGDIRRECCEQPARRRNEAKAVLKNLIKDVSPRQEFLQHAQACH
tara:strand:- start:1772 stop:2116 length:345 start_codon:yes stop_codon:yes gene_type:complete